MLTNLRIALRSLWKARGFSVIAILTLAVGIGSTTAIFSALRALVMQPFDYPQPDQLVHIWSDDSWPLSPADALDIRSDAKSFNAFGIYQPQPVNVGRENAQSYLAMRGTSDVLRVFGVQPMLGRFFQATDDAVGAAPVVIISYAFWQEHFGGDPKVIGHNLHVEGAEAAVVGVMPPGFEFVCPWTRTEDCHLWLPLSFDDKQKTRRDSHFLLGIARMRPGLAMAAADAEIKAIGKRLAKAYPDTNTDKPFLVRSLYVEMTKDLRQQVWLLFGAVGLVLLVACANVASMLLARSVKRQGEFAVRMALGASRGQLMRLVMSESAVLAAASAALGIALAFWGVNILRVIAPLNEARRAAIAVNVGALEFAVGAAALTALLAGFSPALAAMRTSLAGVMRADARGAVGSQSRHRLLRGLIIAQVAVAFVLATGAVLFSRGYIKLMEENQLLANDRVVTASVSLSGPRYSDDKAQDRFWYELTNHIKALSGVSNSAMTSKLPLGGGSNTNALVNNETYDPTIHRMQVERSSVTEGYLTSMGIRLLQGRNLQPEDREGDIRGVVVNQKLVDRAWPNKNPLGEIMRGNNPGKPWFTLRVVGVAENVKQWSAEAPVQPEMYLTPEGHWGHTAYLVVRTTLPLAVIAPMLRRELAKIDGELAFRDVRSMRQVVETSTQGQRAIAELVNFFMVIALGLVAVGLYGTLSYHVQQRTREIGVRVAIGAMKLDIFGLIFAQGGRWIAFGVTLGLAGSVAVSTLLKTLVFGMTELTALPLLLACAAVGIAALIACWLPARRAARLDPLEALRAD